MPPFRLFLDPDLDARFAPYAAHGPGACLGVFVQGRLAWGRAYGLARLAPRVPVGVGTAFRLASLSKAFTAAAVLHLAAAGRLRLGQPADAFLTPWPRRLPVPTVYELLTHTSGLPDYEALRPAAAALTDGDVLSLLAAAPRPAGVPGRAFRYSNTGYALLALVAEAVSGLPFADLLHAAVFTPLGMHHSGVNTPGHRPATAALGYRLAPTPTPDDQSPTSTVLGDGGVYTSLADLARWEGARFRGGLLPPAAWQLMETPAHCHGAALMPYGMGWFVDTDRGRHRLTHHGETAGFTHAAIRYPAAALSVWVLTNRAGGTPWHLAQHAADRALAHLGVPCSGRAAPWPCLGGPALRGPLP